MLNWIKLNWILQNKHFIRGITSSNNTQNRRKGVFEFLSFINMNICLQCAVSKTWLYGVVIWNFGDCCSLLGVILPITPMIFRTPLGNYFLVAVKGFAMAKPSI